MRIIHLCPMATRPWQQCDFPSNLYQALKFIINHDSITTRKRFPHYWPVMRGLQHTRGLEKMSSNVELYVFFLVWLNKRLDKQLSCRSYNTQCRSYDVIVMRCIIVPLDGWRCLNTDDYVLWKEFTEYIIISHYSDATWAPLNLRSYTLP